MQLSQIRYVLMVQKCGSISKAAGELFITQPSLSQQLSLLEKELQVRLFVRGRRGVTLTDAGEEFVAYSRRIVPEVDNLLESMNSFAVRTKGRIKIGVLWIFAELGLAGLISDFCAVYPEIETVITVNGSVRLLDMLRNRELDAIFYRRC